MWTVSMLQMHRRACVVCDEDATMELKVKTIKYFTGLRAAHTQSHSDGSAGQGSGISDSLGDTNPTTEAFLYANRPLQRSDSTSSVVSNICTSLGGTDSFTSPRNQASGSLTSRTITSSSRKRKAPGDNDSSSSVGGEHPDDDQ